MMIGPETLLFKKIRSLTICLYLSKQNTLNCVALPDNVIPRIRVATVDDLFEEPK